MDGLCIKGGINGFSSSPISSLEPHRKHCAAPAAQISALGRSSNGVSLDGSSSTSVRFSFAQPLRSLWPGGGGGGRKRNDRVALDDPIVVVEKEREEEAGEETETEEMRSEERRENWVLKILRIRSLWKEKEGSRGGDVAESGGESCGGEDGECSCCDKQKKKQLEEEQEEEEEEKEEVVVEFDRDSFSRLLRRVSLNEARLYAQMSYLGNLAYSIPKIKPGNLLKHHGLSYITSSLEKKEQSKGEEKPKVQETEEKPEKEEKEVADSAKSGYGISASTAYRIAAAAASYVQSHTRSILPFKSSKNGTGEDSPDGVVGGNENAEITSSEVASFMVTRDSLTAVVSAKEEMKQAVAKDLNSVNSSPCEWFICDDNKSGTRIISIQGSDTLASWQANLLFEPIQFEGLDVLVHRGIYEAAKGIYEQIIPEVREYLQSHGDSASFRFTGHSLGGSLSLLINLMLIIRGEVPISSLLPVITFGSPTIMCGGDQLLRRLGLPRRHVQSIAMHRDIVPRAFSCKYPDSVIDILRAVNRNFRNHPCLKNQKLLYDPMGEILILQPDEKISPSHHLLPSGNGLYVLSCQMSDLKDPEKQLQAARTVFMNSPHPLEILSDKSAYGSGGAIYRDHDMKAYLKSVRGVIRQELSHIRKAKREHRRRVYWPLVVPQEIHSGVNVGGQFASTRITGNHPTLSGIFRSGGESLKRFSRLVTSQHIHLLILVIFPVRLLVVGVQAVFSFH